MNLNTKKYVSRESYFNSASSEYKEPSLKWKYIGTLDNIQDNNLRQQVGIYKAVLKGKIVYIGRAVEYNNGGLKKRLADYTRKSDSGRRHQSGQLMHENASQLKIYVMVTGSGHEAADRAKKLEKEMIDKYNPPWNIQHY